MDKATLRASLLAARRGRSATDLAAARAAVCATVLARSGRWRRVAAYEPLRTEPGSVELLAGLAGLGIEVLVPVTLADRDLAWRTGPVELGVAAIALCDAVLVPALAVATADGARLGRGGGSYDRALARVAAGVPVVALLFDGELVPSLPSDPWDRPVSAVVTPSGWTDVPRVD